MSFKMTEIKKIIEKKTAIQQEGQITTEELRRVISVLQNEVAQKPLLTPCSDSNSSVLTLTAGIPSSINILFSKALVS